MARLTSIHELGVEQAHGILVETLGEDPTSLPPLEVIENEDWGRDLVLGRLLDMPSERLAAAGLFLPAPGPPQQAELDGCDDAARS